VSDLKVDGIIASTGTNTNLTLQGKGAGKVAIGDGALLFPDADGSADQVIKTDGSGVLQFVTPAAAGWNIIGTETTSGSGTATLDVTGLDSTYDTYAIALSDILPITDNAIPYLRLGDSSGVDSGASDYAWYAVGDNISNTTFAAGGAEDNADAQIRMMDDSNWGAVGNAAGEGMGGMFFLHQPGDGVVYPTISGTCMFLSPDSPTRFISTHMGGGRHSAITTDRVQFLFSSGNIESGRMTVWGIAHA